MKKLNVKVELKKDVQLNRCGYFVSTLVAQALCKNEETKLFHKEKKSKHYSITMLKGFVEKNKFEKGKIYFFDVKSSNLKLLAYLHRFLIDTENDYGKVISVEILEEEIPSKIVKMKTLSPYCLTRTDNQTLEEDRKFLNKGIVKKFNSFTNTTVSEDFEFIKSIKKEKDVKCIAKDKIIFIGTKAEFEIGEDELSQKLAKFAYINGIGEKTSYIAAGCLGIVGD